MFSKLFRKQQTRQTAFVALFVAGLLLAQLATVFHDADHAFHEHTHLCDAFTAYDHGKNPLAATSALDFTFETFVVFHVFTVSSPLQTASTVTRIRGPPSLPV